MLGKCKIIQSPTEIVAWIRVAFVVDHQVQERKTSDNTQLGRKSTAQRNVAREFRDIFDVLLEDGENEDIVQNARRKLESQKHQVHGTGGDDAKLASLQFQIVMCSASSQRLSSGVVPLVGVC